MKTLRHYNKDLAVVLSVFGSSEPDAMRQYTQLYEEIKQNLPLECELKLAISSRTVLKNLEKQGRSHCTLAEQLASLDRLGYKKVVVVSVNLFPTQEHENVLRVVEGFKKISPYTKYETTMPVFGKTNHTNIFLSSLNEEIRAKYDAPNIFYLAHGHRNFISQGSYVYSYVKDYLKLLNPRNFFYTLEGCFSYKEELLSSEIERENKNSEAAKSILLVPLLLVAGEHYKNDILETKSELSEKFDSVEIPSNFASEDDFSLLKLQKTRDYFRNEVQEAIKKINW